MKPTIFITGANRGIGLGLAREFLRGGWQVLAGYRGGDGAEVLRTLSNGADLQPVQIDIASDSSVRAAVDAVRKVVSSVDVLVNNAGVNPEPRDASLATLSPDAIAEVLNVNTLGAVRVTQAFLPLLRAGNNPRVVNLSSGAGSLAHNPVRSTQYAYCMSKAALNMFTNRAAAELGREGITVVSVTPGGVRTDMGGPDKELDVAECAATLAPAIAALSREQNGRWLDRHGHPSPYAW